MSGRVAAHVAAFNDTVRSGAWGLFSERSTEAATLAFEGVPVGPFAGRSAISAAYVGQPPTDTMTITDVATDGSRDTVRFQWTAGGTGTMRLTWDGDLVDELVVSFDV